MPIELLEEMIEPLDKEKDVKSTKQSDQPKDGSIDQMES